MNSHINTSLLEHDPIIFNLIKDEEKRQREEGDQKGFALMIVDQFSCVRANNRFCVPYSSQGTSRIENLLKTCVHIIYGYALKEYESRKTIQRQEI